MNHKIRSYQWTNDGLITKDYEFPSYEHALSFYKRNISEFFHSHKIKIFDEQGHPVFSTLQETSTYA